MRVSGPASLWPGAFCRAQDIPAAGGASLRQPSSLLQNELRHACRQLLAEAVHIVGGIDLCHRPLQRNSLRIATELPWNYRGTIPELSRNYAETALLHYVFTDSSAGSSRSLCP